jgi:hypothetical protein
LLHSTRMTPFRRITLQLAHRGFTDALTFISLNPAPDG